MIELAISMLQNLYLLLYVENLISVKTVNAHALAACQSVDFRFKLAVQVLPDVACSALCAEYTEELQSQLTPLLIRGEEGPQQCFMQNKKCYGNPKFTATSAKSAAALVQAGYPDPEKFPRWQPRLPDEEDAFCGCDAAMFVYRVRQPTASFDCEPWKVCQRFQMALLPIKNPQAAQLAPWHCTGALVRDPAVPCFPSAKDRPDYLIWCTNCNPQCLVWEGRSDQARPNSRPVNCLDLHPFDPSTYQTVNSKINAVKVARKANGRAAKVEAAAERARLYKNPSKKPRLSKAKATFDLAPAVDAQQRLPHDIYNSQPGNNQLPRVVADSNWPFNQQLPMTGLTSALAARPGPAVMPHFQPQPWHIRNEASTSHPRDPRGRLPPTGRPHQPYTPETFNFGQAAAPQPLRELQLLDKFMADTAEDGDADEPTGVLMTETNEAGVSLDLTLAQPLIEPATDNINSSAESGVEEAAHGECGPWGGMM